MTNLFALPVVRPAGTVSIRSAGAPTMVENTVKLAGLLRQACHEDGGVMYSLLARALNAHLHGAHEDAATNGRIRDALDEIQLMISLELEREGPSESSFSQSIQRYAG